MILNFSKIFLIFTICFLAIFFKLEISLALNDDQSEMYQGCVENAKQLGEERAKQYCRCITIMITEKYTIDEIESIGLMEQEIQLEKFNFATSYCNLNANAPSDKD